MIKINPFLEVTFRMRLITVPAFGSETTRQEA